MKKKRLFRKLGSHDSPVHSRKDALRVKRTCEQYVRNLQFMHERSVAHLQDENKRLKDVAEAKRGDIMLHLEAGKVKSACNDMQIDERYMGAVPSFAVSCHRYGPNAALGNGTATYRIRLDYDASVPPFDRNSCMLILDRIHHLFNYITKGNC